MQKKIRATTLALGTFALAGFCGSASAAWTLTNDSGGDGTLLDGAYPTFTIAGANNGTGDFGNDNTTFYTTTFSSSTIVSFTWAFNTTDAGGTIYDQGGYIVGGDEHQLSALNLDDTASGGNVAGLVVPANTTFGFYVHSDDSLGGPGYLAINEALPVISSPPPPPPPPPAIPEPGNAALVMAGLAALFAAARRGKN
jgi:MYXO-CTERM domain-containing protein